MPKNAQATVQLQSFHNCNHFTIDARKLASWQRYYEEDGRIKQKEKLDNEISSEKCRDRDEICEYNSYLSVKQELKSEGNKLAELEKERKK